MNYNIMCFTIVWVIQFCHRYRFESSVDIPLSTIYKSLKVCCESFTDSRVSLTVELQLVCGWIANHLWSNCFMRWLNSAGTVAGSLVHHVWDILTFYLTLSDFAPHYQMDRNGKVTFALHLYAANYLPGWSTFYLCPISNHLSVCLCCLWYFVVLWRGVITNQYTIAT